MGFFQTVKDAVVSRVGRFVETAKTAAETVAQKAQHPLGLHIASRVEPSDEWTLDRLRRALSAHERGDFRESATLAEYIRRDARTFATLESRVLASLGGERVIEPSHSPAVTSKRLAKAIAANVESWWFECLPEATQGDLLRWAIVMGFALGELSWHRSPDDPESDLVYPTMIVHNPGAVRYDQNTRKLFLRLKDGSETEITPGDGRWVLFSLGSGQQPWMHGAIRAIAVPWFLLASVVQDWARRAEIEATGIRVAKIPADYNKEKVKKFLRQIARLGKETALTLPVGYDFSIVTVDKGAHESFQKLADRCDTNITLVLLGQNLTTQIEGGSFAAAQTHAKVQLERVKADVGGLSTCLRYQVLMPWGKFNYPTWKRDYAPWPLFDTKPPEDKQKEAQALLTLAQALPALLAHGVDLEPIFEKFGLSTLENDQNKALPPIFAYHLTAGVVTANEVRGRLQLPPVENGNALLGATPEAVPTPTPTPTPPQTPPPTQQAA